MSISQRPKLAVGRGLSVQNDRLSSPIYEWTLYWLHSSSC